MEFNLPDSAILYADGARGVYIPQYFAESIKRDAVKGFEGAHNWDDISDPDNEYYWQSWTVFLDHAIVTDPSTGIAYRLYQDGDLWLVPVDWNPDEDEDEDEDEESAHV